MKSALILEKDTQACVRMSKLLSCLGYVTAPVRTAEEALNVVRAIKFNVIVTCTATRRHDRRLLTGELKRAAPDAAVVLIAENDEECKSLLYRAQGLSAVLRRPPTADALRRVIDFGLDGYGLQPAYEPPPLERRKSMLYLATS